MISKEEAITKEEFIKESRENVKRDMRDRSREWLKYMQHTIGKVDECHEEIVHFNPLGEKYRVVIDIIKE